MNEQQIESPKRSLMRGRLRTWGAVGAVGIVGVGFLYLSGLFANVVQWAVGLTIVGVVSGGVYVYGRRRVRAAKARFDEKATARRESAELEARQQSAEAQLEALKKKRDG